MIYSNENRPAVLATKKVPNGRWPEHTVEVCEQFGKFYYCNGWSDPWICEDREEAFRHFNENTGRAPA